MRTAFFLIFSLFFSFCLGQQKEKKDLKVGLVLSGGGAKGLAHIGALKVIDSLGIQIDYISGTSAGAIVGGLYASGYSGKAIDSIFHSIDYRLLLNNKVKRQNKTFYERDNAEKYAMSLPYKNLKILLPKALSNGQNIFNLLSKLTLHLSEIEDFSQLPIPFECIATDMATGHQVVLNKGNLASAISASSALPTLFQPFEIEGKTLMDGGIVNNYPVDILKNKGLDIIIGVDVQDSIYFVQDLKTASDILNQVNNFRSAKEMEDKRKLTDIYIKPDIDSYGITSFSKANAIIQNGYIATAKRADVLKEIALYQKKRERFVTPFFQGDLKLNTTTISGNNMYTRAYIMGKLRLQKRETITFDDFSDGVNNLLGTKNFDGFIYDFEAVGDGYNLNAIVRESKQTQFVKFGLHYDRLYKSAVLLNYTKKRLLLKNDVISFDFVLGDNVRYNFDYYIDKGFYWSIGVNSNYNRFVYKMNPYFFSPIFIDNQRKLTTSYSDFSNQLFLQTLLNKDISFKAGLEYKKIKAVTTDIQESNFNTEANYQLNSSKFFSFFSLFKLDNYDDNFFPTKGNLLELRWNFFFSGNTSSDDFNRFSIFNASLGKAVSLNSKTALRFSIDGGYKTSPMSTSALNFGLGGYGFKRTNNFIHFHGAEFNSLIGNSYLKLEGNLDYEFSDKHHFEINVNFASVSTNVFGNFNLWDKPFDHSGYAIGYGFETLLGPIQIKYSRSPTLKSNILFVNLGYWF